MNRKPHKLTLSHINLQTLEEIPYPFPSTRSFRLLFRLMGRPLAPPAFGCRQGSGATAHQAFHIHVISAAQGSDGHGVEIIGKGEDLPRLHGVFLPKEDGFQRIYRLTDQVDRKVGFWGHLQLVTKGWKNDTCHKALQIKGATCQSIDSFQSPVCHGRGDRFI